MKTRSQPATASSQPSPDVDEERRSLSIMLGDLLFMYHDPLIARRKPIAAALGLAIELLEKETLQMAHPSSLPR